MNGNEQTGLAAERLESIRKLLKQRGVMRVNDLCKELNVSPATIRRDLADLNSHGLAKRVHGGVVSVEGLLDEPVFDDKAGFSAKEKQSIAETALKFIKPNSSIFLDGGSTVLALARLITDIPRLTVVTNSLRVAHVLSASGPRLIVTGGELRRLSQTFVGPTTAPGLEQVYIDIAFMGTIGITDREGLTTTDPAEAFTKKTVIQRARQVILLADHSKLGKVSFAKFGAIEDVDILVTDSRANRNFLGKLREKGVKVTI